MGKFEPRTAQSKRANLEATITTPQASRVEELDSILLQPEGNIKRYEELAGRPLEETCTVTVLPDTCVPALRSKLEMSSRDMSYREVKEDALAYIGRRHDFSTRPVPMDIGIHEEEGEEDSYTYHAPKLQNWRGAAEPYDLDDGLRVYPDENYSCKAPFYLPRGGPDAGMMPYSLGKEHPGK